MVDGGKRTVTQPGYPQDWLKMVDYDGALVAGKELFVEQKIRLKHDQLVADKVIRGQEGQEEQQQDAQDVQREAEVYM